MTPPPEAQPTGSWRCRARAAVRLALDWLEDQQYDAADEARWSVYEGDWPQFAIAGWGPVRVRRREVSPFCSTFIHHALSHVTAANAESLGLARSDLDRAARMRTAAAGMMRRFAAPEDSACAGAFGFWPKHPGRQSAFQKLVGNVLRFPAEARSYGLLAPLYFGSLPPVFRIWWDCDDTALVTAALSESARLDTGPGPDGSFVSLLASRRDLPGVSRGFPSWLPAGSGTFLTWLPEPGTPDFKDEVDCVISANVLFALGLCDALDTPGADAAVRVVTRAVRERRHHRMELLSRYYGDTFAFHYTVSRAFHEGGATGLGWATAALADEIASHARRLAEGGVIWDRGHPHLNTAFAILTLFNAGRGGELATGGIRYLLGAQESAGGFWEEAPFCVGSPNPSIEASWRSSAFTTAIALEALCRSLADP